MMKKAYERGKLVGYRFKAGDKRFSHTQYAYDTMIISEKSWTNIQAIKAIVLLFELMS